MYQTIEHYKSSDLFIILINKFKNKGKQRMGTFSTFASIQTIQNTLQILAQPTNVNGIFNIFSSLLWQCIMHA